jgi:hypothetical protein
MNRLLQFNVIKLRKKVAVSSLCIVVIANNHFVSQLKRRDDACCEACKDEAIQHTVFSGLLPARASQSQ